MTIWTLLTAALVAGHAPQSPQSPQSPTPPSCADDIGFLQAKIQANYAGFLLEVTGAKRRAFDRMIAGVRTRAARDPAADCLPLLRQVTNWFEDPHLFIFESTRIDTAESGRRARAVAMSDMDEGKARAYYARQASHLDPIEGIWYDGPLRMAVVPVPQAGRGHFMAVVLRSDTSSWPVGAIRARLHRVGNRYHAEVYTAKYALRHLDGDIYKHVMLRLSPGIWGKEYPVAAADSGLLDPVDVHRATFAKRGAAIVISIPSHDPTYRGAFDSLMAAHAPDLLTVRDLVIDLRGNEGGSSGMTAALLPYIASSPMKPSILGGGGMILSSPDLIALARGWAPDSDASLRRLITRMQESPGKLVPLDDPHDPVRPPTRDSVIRGPRHVGVLIDRGTVSASEVMVVEAKRSSRATVFGEPTAGALDYQSVSIVPIAASEKRWYLGYPTITRNASLPRGGMRGRGIPPDVRMELKSVRDPIAFVVRSLQRMP